MLFFNNTLNTSTTKKSVALAAIVLSAGLALSACGAPAQQADNQSASQGAPSATAAAPTSGTHAGEAEVHAHEQWVKATDTDMSAFFGQISNHGDQDRTIVAASSDVAGMVQLHTTVTTANGGTEMKEVEGGFKLAAGSDLELAPGGNHIMLMGLKRQLEAGDTVTVTLTLDNGEKVAIDAPVKAFAGAKESYAPTGDTSTDHSGH